MIIGLLRIKNEARWIDRVIESMFPVCDWVLVMDDHSTDDTKARCERHNGVTVFDSPFEGLDETRDKNWLLDQAEDLKPDRILFIDGDEMIAPGYTEQLRSALLGPAPCLSFRVFYLWDREDQVRADGVYGDFHRESAFRPNGSRFESNRNGGNFHCGNVPRGNRQGRQVLEIPLLHFGYLHREDRERKYAWYNQLDPNNVIEDRYRHMVIGDLFPADSRFMHAGPLCLLPLEAPVQ